jgi:hypothetical protein
MCRAISGRVERAVNHQCSATIVRPSSLAASPCPSISASTANTNSRLTTTASRAALMSRAAGRLRPPPRAPEGRRRGANYPGAYGAAPQSPWSRTGDSASSDNSWVSDLDGEINSGVGAHRSALTCARGSTFVDCVLSSLGTHRKPSRRRCWLAGCPIHASPILGRNGGGAPYFLTAQSAPPP